MPFKSQAQRRWMYRNLPKIAQQWERETPKGQPLPERTETVETEQTTEPADPTQVETQIEETETLETVDTPEESTVTEEDFVELKTLSDPNISQSQKNKAFNRVITRLTKKGKTLTRTAAALIKKVKTLDLSLIHISEPTRPY